MNKPYKIFYIRQKAKLSTPYDPRIDDDILFFQARLERLKQPDRIPYQKQTSKAALNRQLAFHDFAIKTHQACLSLLEHFKEAPGYPLDTITAMKKNIPHTC